MTGTPGPSMTATVRTNVVLAKESKLLQITALSIRRRTRRISALKLLYATKVMAPMFQMRLALNLSGTPGTSMTATVRTNVEVMKKSEKEQGSLNSQAYIAPKRVSKCGTTLAIGPPSAGNTAILTATTISNILDGSLSCSTCAIGRSHADNGELIEKASAATWVATRGDRKLTAATTAAIAATTDTLRSSACDGAATRHILPTYRTP